MLCRKCSSPLTSDNWSASRKLKADYICTSCKSTEMKAFRQYHKDTLKENLELSRKDNSCCTTCGNELVGTLKMPYGSMCRICNNQRAYTNDKGTIEYKLWVGARSRARSPKKPREFNIEISDIIIPLLCPVFSVPLERATGSRGATEYSPTLDRIDSSKGYVKGNIEVISWKANRLKSNGTLRDFEALVRHLEAK